MNQQLCPCDSGKTFVRCCKPYLTGSTKPKTARQLMRARFSAYAIGGCGNFLLATWHPLNRQGLDAGSLSLRQVNWQKLEILHSSQQADKATVEFRASFVDRHGKPGLHHEVSVFKRERGVWFYVGELNKTEIE